MRFVDVKNDIAFRKIFGNENHTQALISFLNAILDFHGDQKIKKVTILNPYQLPKLKGGKVTIVDVRASDQTGRSFIVEMQIADVDGFDKRVFYYTSRSYADQIKRGDFFRQLNPVIFIGILDFIHTKNEKYISRSRILDVETGEQTVTPVEFTFIELPKFTKTLSEVETLTDKWVYFLKNSENLEVVPDNVTDEGLKSAYVEANVGTWTIEELAAYDYAFMREEDERARMDKARQIAKLAGELAGEAKVVYKLYNKGKTPEEIAGLLDLEEEKVSQIISGYGGKKPLSTD